MESIYLTARFVVENSACIHHPGAIEVRHGRVVDVGHPNRIADRRSCIDLGDSVLLPGLINPHTHLEFSDFAHPIPAPATFADWILQVIRHRQAVAQRAEEDLQPHRDAVCNRGLLECWQTGSAVVVDIATCPWQPHYQWQASGRAIARQFADSLGRGDLSDAVGRHLGPVLGPRVVCLAEVIGLDARRLQTAIEWAQMLVASGRGDWASLGDRAIDAVAAQLDDRKAPMQVGVSPHAPYSIRWSAEVQQAIESMLRHRVAAMHVAESREELEYLADGTGPLADLWNRLGISTPEHRWSIDRVIAWLGRAKWSLVVHGNYLTPGQIETIGQNRSMSIVFCPRTHRHFGHQCYPLDQMRQAGVRVVLGTDSRASNPDLNLWMEVLECRRRYPQCDPGWALDMVTRDAAEALGIERRFGTLSIGKYAFCNWIPADPKWTERDLLDAITSGPAMPRPAWQGPASTVCEQQAPPIPPEESPQVE
ncbi:MAG: hypothetical protein D6753_17760 [Planctomycetota bacterium]|nr:MAG: hypothetical protein D6753_17760 [Planctomycetota bacterium]